MSWLKNRSSRPRREKWGTAVETDPKHPKANCHVFRVIGKKWQLIPGHLFYKVALSKAKRLFKEQDPLSPFNFVVKRKQKILWNSADEREKKAA